MTFMWWLPILLAVCLALRTPLFWIQDNLPWYVSFLAQGAMAVALFAFIGWLAQNYTL